MSDYADDLKRLEQPCNEYARIAYDEMVNDPSAFGIDRPWQMIGDWVRFEFQGDARDEAHRLASQCGTTFDTAQNALEKALLKIAKLSELNTHLGEPEPLIEAE